MFRTIPFNIRENAEKGRELMEKALDFAAGQSFHPFGRVSAVISPFRVDVVDTDASYELFAELPGFAKEQIHVSYDENNCLRIKAERPVPEMQVRYLCRERRCGDFEREFFVDGIDPEGVSAAYEDGVLHLVLPKVKEMDNRTVFTIE